MRRVSQRRNLIDGSDLSLVKLISPPIRNPLGINKLGNSLRVCISGSARFVSAKGVV